MPISGIAGQVGALRKRFGAPGGDVATGGLTGGQGYDPISTVMKDGRSGIDPATGVPYGSSYSQAGAGPYGGAQDFTAGGPYERAVADASALQARVTAPITGAQQAQRDQRRGNYARTQPGLNQVPATQRPVNVPGGGLGTGGDVATGGLTGGLRPQPQFSGVNATTVSPGPEVEQIGLDYKNGLITFEEANARYAALDTGGGFTPAPGSVDLSTTGGLSGQTDYSQAFGNVPGAVTPATDLSGVYTNQLGREPDQEGMAWYQGKIDRGEMTFDQARQAIIKSEEGRGYNTPREQYIADAYMKEFGREPDPQGMDFYLNNPDQLANLGGTLDQSQEAYDTGTASNLGVVDKVTQQIEDKYGEATGATETYGETAYDALKTSAEESAEPLDPYSEAGQEALNMINDLSGINGPEAQQAAMDAYRSSPALAAKLKQSEDMMTRMAAATGQLGGGNLLKGLQESALTLHDLDFQNYMDQLGGIAEGGLTAGSQLANLKSQYGRDVAGVAGQIAGLDVNSAQWAGTGISNAQLESAFQTGQWEQDAAWQQAQLDVMQTNKLDGLLESSENKLMEIISGTLTSITATQAMNLKFLISIDSQLASDLVGTFGSGSSSTGAWDPVTVQVDAMKIIDGLTNKKEGD